MHQGEFLTGSMDSVHASVLMQTESHEGIHVVLQDQQAVPAPLDYKDPTQTLPVPAPIHCKDPSTCELPCKCSIDWWNDYRKTVDDLLLKSNVHRCTKPSAA